MLDDERGMTAMLRSAAGGNRRAVRTELRSAAPVIVFLAALVVLCQASLAAAQANRTTLRMGTSVTVPPGERVWGDVAAIGGTIEVYGTVDGDVVAIGGSITVDGWVRGDVVALGGHIRLGPNARVSGDVSVVGGTIARDPSAVVLGRVRTLTPAQAFDFGREWLHVLSSPWLDLPWSILYVLGLFALAVIVVAIAPDNVHAVAAHMESNAGRSILIGLLALLLLAPLTVALIVTIIGPPLLWMCFWAAKLLGYVALVSLVGWRVAGRLLGSRSLIAQLAIGVLLVALVRYIPVVGALFSLVVTVWGVGAVLDTKFSTNQPWLPPRQAAQHP